MRPQDIRKVRAGRGKQGPGLMLTQPGDSPALSRATEPQCQPGEGWGSRSSCLEALHQGCGRMGFVLRTPSHEGVQGNPCLPSASQDSRPSPGTSACLQQALLKQLPSREQGVKYAHLIY